MWWFNLHCKLCVCEGLQNEIAWPDEEERRDLGLRIPQVHWFCWWHSSEAQEAIWERNHKKNGLRVTRRCIAWTPLMWLIMMVVFRFVDGGYPGSYHDLTIMKHSWMNANWRVAFVNLLRYCEYLLGDSGYIGMDKFLMRGFSKTDIGTLNLSTGVNCLLNV